MNMDRPLVDVIQAILNITPCGDFEQFKRYLLHVQKDVPYTPPENVAIRWEEVMKAINDELYNNGYCGWAVLAYQIAAGTVNYQNYL
jgi:nucleosome binding factor SPN SPT16 subunit